MKSQVCVRGHTCLEQSDSAAATLVHMSNALAPIQRYTCHRATQPLVIDGALDKPAWHSAPKSPRFVDMVSGKPGLLNTQCAALWDDHFFYVGFWVEEPFVRATLTQRDSTIFQENDVEVFIDGIDCYYEFEINALATIYEVFFVWRDAHKPGSRFDTPEFDVHAPDAYSFGGNHDRAAETFWRGTHPRGTRWAFTNWDMPGLKWAVMIDGTLNDDSDIDRGWTVELAFPWAGMRALAGDRSLPPRNGDEWRVFFGRFQPMQFGNQTVGGSWAYDAVGTGDNHLPERFTQVVFSTGTAP
jgi:hypothetical protein